MRGRLRDWLRGLILIVLGSICLAGPATAGVIWLGDPQFIVPPTVLLGAALDDNPPMEIEALDNGFRVKGSLDFVMAARTSLVTWTAQRLFTVDTPNLYRVGTVMDAAIWSNNFQFGTVDEWDDFTQVIGIAGVEIPNEHSIDLIPMDDTVEHGPRPACDEDQCGYLSISDDEADFGIGLPFTVYALRQEVRFIVDAAPGAIVRMDFPVDSTVDPIPEPTIWGLMLVGFLGVGCAARTRRRAAKGV